MAVMHGGYHCSFMYILSLVTVAAKGHVGMAILDQDLSDTAAAGRLFRSQDLKTLADTLADVETKWRAIGLALGLNQHSLEALQKSPTVCPLSGVLKLWLQNLKQPTVEHFASVLQDIGEGTAAQRIRKEFSHQEGKCACVHIVLLVMEKLFLLFCKKLVGLQNTALVL